MPKKPKYDICCTEPNVQHYKSSNVEAIEIIESIINFASDYITPSEAYLIGNIVKYIRRAGLKEGAHWMDDCMKAADYIVRFKTGEWAQ